MASSANVSYFSRLQANGDFLRFVRPSGDEATVPPIKSLQVWARQGPLAQEEILAIVNKHFAESNLPVKTVTQILWRDIDGIIIEIIKKSTSNSALIRKYVFIRKQRKEIYQQNYYKYDNDNFRELDDASLYREEQEVIGELSKECFRNRPVKTENALEYIERRFPEAYAAHKITVAMIREQDVPLYDALKHLARKRQCPLADLLPLGEHKRGRPRLADEQLRQMLDPVDPIQALALQALDRRANQRKWNHNHQNRLKKLSR